MFLLTHFWFIVVSGTISMIILGLASADKGQASFNLMLLTPIITVVHHTIVVFLPTYRLSHVEFDASLKGGAFAQPITPPTHTERIYLAFLILASILWSMSVVTTFYVVGFNVASGATGVVMYTGPLECAFGFVEASISWVMFVTCLNQRIFHYDGLPSA